MTKLIDMKAKYGDRYWSMRQIMKAVDIVSGIRLGVWNDNRKHVEICHRSVAWVIMVSIGHNVKDIAFTTERDRTTIAYGVSTAREKILNDENGMDSIYTRLIEQLERTPGGGRGAVIALARREHARLALLMEKSGGRDDQPPPHDLHQGL